jgi:8-oxo-dGTP diphosphatase
MAYTYEYPRPAVTVDCIVFRNNKQKTEILLVERKSPPFQGEWALPGGFMEIDERLVDAAARELAEETGLKKIELKQFYTFDEPGRDPRHRTISTVFIGELTDANQKPKASSDAKSVKWYSIRDLPELAFDHGDIIKLAASRYVF